MKRMLRVLRGKRGSEMVEAAIALPTVILTVMLLVRVFVFYLEILDTGVCAHIEASQLQDGYSGFVMRTRTETEYVELMKGGVLGIDLTKKIEIRSYLFNEDLAVRAGEVIDQ